MVKYRIIGNMTGNSMDAIDLVITEFNNEKIQDIATFSKPYDKEMQNRMENLRLSVFRKTRAQIEKLPQFKAVHDDYIRQIADSINEMCAINYIDKKSIDAIGFHGKTLDHNPPSKAKTDGSCPYSVQMGSGQMLADLTGIPVIYDFRSDFLLNGFDGAPLVAPHNAHISVQEGDGCYYNGGNTSNFAFVKNKKAVINADAGPFNEYTDNYVRLHFAKSYDENAQIGMRGKLNKHLLQKIYELGKTFYEAPLPKSGDPAYYHKSEIFTYAENMNIRPEDVVHTFEYAAAYIAFQALTSVPKNVEILPRIILFGGGWKNPLVYQTFENLIKGKGFVLPQHQEIFAKFLQRVPENIEISQSRFGTYMEARLFADLARYRLEEKAWPIPEVVQADKKIICGVIAVPNEIKRRYSDYLSRATQN